MKLPEWLTGARRKRLAKIKHNRKVKRAMRLLNIDLSLCRRMKAVISRENGSISEWFEWHNLEYERARALLDLKKELL